MIKVHRLGFVLGVIILLLGISNPVWGQHSDWFEEEFDRRMPRGEWDYSDNWRVSSGVARTTSDGGFMYHPGPYDDMVLHTRLRWEADDGRVGVFFRAQDEGTIIFVLFPDGMQLEVPIADTEDVDVLDDTSQHPGDGWHDVVLWAKGEDLVVIFDWEIVFEERIDDHEGGLGIFVDGEGPLEVDFFRVGPMEPLEDLLPNNTVPNSGSADNDDTSSNNNTSNTDTSSPGVSSTQTSGNGDNEDWETDVAITDLFLESAGQMNMRITNHGPKVMNNVNVPVQCEAFGSNDSGAQTHRPPVNWVFTMSAAPGQTETFMTNWTLDRNAYMWTVYCHTNADYDADTSNTEYSESFEQPQPPDDGIGDAHIPQSDLAVTDIYPQSMPQGTIFVRVTNNGPEAINSDVGLICSTKIYGDPNNPVSIATSNGSINANLQPGETKAFHSGLMVNDTNTYQYDITCTVNAGIFDPVPDNNSYNEVVP